MFDGTLYIGNGAWGNLERFSEANFDAFGLSTVRSSLAAFPGRRCDDTSEFEALGRLGKEAFFEEFQIIDHRSVTMEIFGSILCITRFEAYQGSAFPPNV